MSQNPQAGKRLQQPEADCIPLLTHQSCLGIFHLTNFFPKRKNRNTWQLLPETCIRFWFPNVIGKWLWVLWASSLILLEFSCHTLRGSKLLPNSLLIITHPLYHLHPLPEPLVALKTVASSSEQFLSLSTYIQCFSTFPEAPCGVSPGAVSVMSSQWKSLWGNELGREKWNTPVQILR